MLVLNALGELVNGEDAGRCFVSLGVGERHIARNGLHVTIPLRVLDKRIIAKALIGQKNRIGMDNRPSSI